jgi:DNA-binding GntR family transcriptional regulator
MKIKRPKSLTELVVEEVRNRIIDGRLQLGEALSENVLAAELGISKTPVREALLQLKLEKLVEVMPQKGTYVFRIAPDEVAMVSDLRELLELAALAAAMERNHRVLVERMTAIFDRMRLAYEADDTGAYRRIDGEFHQAIIDCCGNTYIADAYVPVAFRTQALRSRLSIEAALNRQSIKEHREILKLIRAGDVPAVQRQMRAHIRQTRQSYLDVLERREAPTNAAAS